MKKQETEAEAIERRRKAHNCNGLCYGRIDRDCIIEPCNKVTECEETRCDECRARLLANVTIALITVVLIAFIILVM